MVPVGYQNGTFWVPSESVKADTLSLPLSGFSPVCTLTLYKRKTYFRNNKIGICKQKKKNTIENK